MMGEMKRLSQVLKDLDPTYLLHMLNQSVRLMGVIVEKLDEISSKLDGSSCNDSCSWFSAVTTSGELAFCDGDCYTGEVLWTGAEKKDEDLK